MIRGALLGFIFHILGIKLPVSVEGPIKQFANLTTPLALFVLGGTLHFNAIGGNLKYVVPSMTFKMVIPAGSDSGGCDAARLFRCGTFCLL